MWLCRCVWVYVGGLSSANGNGHDGWMVRIPFGDGTLREGPWVWIVHARSGRGNEWIVRMGGLSFW